jgi:hypothetical protein
LLKYFYFMCFHTLPPFSIPFVPPDHPLLQRSKDFLELNARYRMCCLYIKWITRYIEEIFEHTAICYLHMHCCKHVWKKGI